MYEHYIAVDWAQSNMAVARMTGKSDKIHAIDVPASLQDLKIYLKELKGKKFLTVEETTTSQWLYTELLDHVDRILVCDPNRNRLLSEGGKTDKIDASKLVQLLRAGLLKEVFHSGDDFIYMRKLVSGYEDLIQAGVRAKNQRSALFRAFQKDHKRETKLSCESSTFVLEGLDRTINQYEEEKLRYENKFKTLAKKYKPIRNIKRIPGVGDITAVKIVARVVDANRFTRNSWWCYCGLVKLDKMSGGRSYGKKNPRYCRSMKTAFKIAALSTIRGENQFRDYYEYLVTEKRYPEHQARHAVSRKIASITLGVLKEGKGFQPNRKRKLKESIKISA